jgi:hypothetical protein
MTWLGLSICPSLNIRFSVQYSHRDYHAIPEDEKDRGHYEWQDSLDGVIEHGGIPNQDHEEADTHDEEVLTCKSNYVIS